MKRRKIYVREFKCPVCGSIMFAPKRSNCITSSDHIKTMYCYKCKKSRKFVQLNKYGDKKNTLKLKPIRIGITFNIPTFSNMLDFGYEVRDITLKYGNNNLTIGFDSWTCKYIKIKNKTTLTIESGHGEFDDYSTIGKSYIKKIKKQGFDPEALNAHFLHNADEIINVDLRTYVGDIKLNPTVEKIYFISGKKVYYVRNVIVNKYNSIL